jgi:glycosyltransferase involved in cell wall biosynthesis
VVDGTSTDATERIARSYDKVIFFQQADKGFANAWNCGVRLARGKFLSFIDSDDVWEPHKLACQSDLLASDSNLVAVIGKVLFFCEPDEVPPRSFRDKVLGRPHLAHMPGVLMARHDLFDRLGNWSEDCTVTNDIDWFLQLKDSGLTVGVIDDVLLHKRVHSQNLSYVTRPDNVYQREILRLLHASIIRKRVASAVERDTES